MNSTTQARFQRLPTPVKLLLLLSLALLPIGAMLVWSAVTSVRDARQALTARADAEAMVTSRTVESLIARNALALRVAANAVLRDPAASDCEEMQRTLAIAPAVAQPFELADGAGVRICEAGGLAAIDIPPPVAPGDIRVWVSSDDQSLLLRVGVIGGSATSKINGKLMRDAIAASATPSLELVVIDDGHANLPLFDRPGGEESPTRLNRVSIGNGRLEARISSRRADVAQGEQLGIFLPVLMWALAALISWWLVHRLLIQPLRRLQRAVAEYQPGDDRRMILPRGLGPATEIHDLGLSFARAVQRIEQAEEQMAEALEGQRRLVREVHHRVKNNLQVIASLLSIHGRNAEGPEAQAAYAAIGRRVDALAVVHRNHFAEMEDSQGISLRPLLNELVTALRGSAPGAARAMTIELDADPTATTQDVAVAIAFLVTEVVEHSMLAQPGCSVEIGLRRTGPLTARLLLSSPALIDQDGQSTAARKQFERIIEGLARQLRSPLERRLGRYGVDFPVFPQK